MKSAVFFERDGILNVVPSHGRAQASPRRVEDFRVNTDAFGALTRLKEAGFTLIATTNQPGVSRGEITRRELDLMHRVLKRRLPIDDVYLCPYEESDGCPCFKPALGMFREAAYAWNLDLNQSYVVSDKWRDARAALNMGGISVMLRSPWIGDVHHDFVCDSLDDIADRILNLKAAPASCLMMA